MSILDRVVAAVTPPESEEARAMARKKARGLAGDNDWLAQVLHHHEQIESAFAQVRNAGDSRAQRKAEKELALILTAHSIAEEAVLYPALVKADEKGDSTKAYTEQSAAKIQMSLLEELEPMSQDYLEKLEHLRGAVAHHVYEEEGTWFPELIEKVPSGTQTKLTYRYKEEFDRYFGKETSGAATSRPFARDGVAVNTRGEFL